MPIPVPNSATGGFIRPDGTVTSPLYGDALDDLFHDTIVGVTGLDNKLVRPRWQPAPPTQPPFAADWCAFGIVDSEKDWDPYMRHEPNANTGAGQTVTEQDEQFQLLVSFFGPDAYAYQSLWEDGLKVDQNRAALNAQGIKWMFTGRATQVPSLLKEAWVKRVDQRITFRRRVFRTYAVLNIASADIQLDNEHYITDISVTPPPP